MTETTTALIYMGTNPEPITINVKRITRYSTYRTIIITATDGTIYETYLSNVLLITKKEEK